MKTELRNGGQNLDWLDYPLDIEIYLSETEIAYLSLLRYMTNGIGIEVEYPQDVYNIWLQQIHPVFEAYNLAKQQYDLEFQRRKLILEQYNIELKKYLHQKQEAARIWAKENNVTVARSNSGKSLKKDWLKRLENQGFRHENPPINPFAQNIKAPQPLQLPPRTYLRGRQAPQNTYSVKI